MMGVLGSPEKKNGINTQLKMLRQNIPIFLIGEKVLLQPMSCRSSVWPK